MRGKTCSCQMPKPRSDVSVCQQCGGYLLQDRNVYLPEPPDVPRPLTTLPSYPPVIQDLLDRLQIAESQLVTLRQIVQLLVSRVEELENQGGTDVSDLEEGLAG